MHTIQRHGLMKFQQPSYGVYRGVHTAGIRIYPT